MDNKEFGELTTIVADGLIGILGKIAGIKEEKLVDVASDLRCKHDQPSKSAGDMILEVIRVYRKLQKNTNVKNVSEDEDVNSSGISDIIKRRLENI